MLNDKEAKSKMIADLIPVLESPEGVGIICEQLIREGWRKEKYTRGLENIIQALYDSEINFSISSHWDGGFKVKLGGGYDYDGPFNEESHCETVEAIGICLTTMALKQYPNSKFSKEVK